MRWTNIGWFLAAALLALPATSVADDYDSAARASGTSEYFDEIWTCSPSHAPTAAMPTEGRAANKSTEHFIAEVWSGEAGAASGEPEEEAVGVSGSDEHRAWVKGIWESP